MSTRGSEISAIEVVYVASPFAGDVEANIAYAKAAMHDCLMRGEAPFVPHLLYPLVLEEDRAQRAFGMRAGKAILLRCTLVAVYTDRGESTGMKSEVRFATEHGIRVEHRRIGEIESGSDGGFEGRHVVDLCDS